MTQAEPARRSIGIVGGGAAGVLAARALARACTMSLDRSEPGGFLDWLKLRRPLDRDWGAQDFAPRMAYGDYLAEALAELVKGPACLRLLLDHAVSARFHQG